ncbi:TPA: hypothetical protein L9M98_004671 [Klebsiella pneumoniae]|nr:hypothetical protein [Klebsiella pneumoniae]
MTNETLKPGKDEGVNKASRQRILPVSEQVSITLLLNDVSKRLSAIELSLSPSSNSEPSKPSLFIDILKILLGGWPAFGFIFLILFYFPLKDALNAIPAKVNSATEIGVMGISLKSTIQKEAEKLGSGYLSGAIPNLSTAEIKNLLLQTQSGYGGLITTTANVNARDLTTAVYLPTKETIDAFIELKRKGLLELNGDWKDTSDETYEIIEKFKSNHPGTKKPGESSAEERWSLSKPDTIHDLPSLTWHITPLGKKAIEIIVQSVAKELNPSPNN